MKTSAGGAGWQVAVSAGCEIAERPVWDAASNSLIWVDVLSGTLHRSTPSSEPCGEWSDVMIRAGTTIGAAALRRDGGIVAAVDSAFVLLDSSGGPDGDSVPVDMPLGARFNDGACDPRGRFLAGTTASAEWAKDGVLWSLAVTGEVRVALEDISESNGLDWSPDGTVLYYVDSGDTAIRRYRYALDSGEIRERLADLDDVAGLGSGVPDGLVVDGEGAIWVALWDGGAVRRYAPDGALLDHIDMPVQRPTCPAFAGPDLDLLIVTTGWEGLPAGERAAQPWAGHLLVAPAAVSGRLPHRYAGGVRS